MLTVSDYQLALWFHRQFFIYTVHTRNILAPWLQQIL